MEVLYDFDGPRTFTHKDSAGKLCLAHWCDADRDCNRFIVVPFSEPLVRKLKAGEITLGASLDQPRAWIVDVAHAGDIRAAWGVHLSELPADVLPKPGTMLWPALERLVGPRVNGEVVQEGQPPGNAATKSVGIP